MTTNNEFINQITMEYLVSPTIRSKINHKPTNIKNDLKFYRNRILSLTRDLVMKKGTECMDVKSSFELYVRSCIHHFKTLDNNDSIQQNYIDFDMSGIIIIDCSSNDISCNKISLEDADKLMMRTIPITMDAFVTKTSNKKPVFLPQQHEIDYHDIKYKLKGLVGNVVKNEEHKNNLNNTYEGKNGPSSKEKIKKQIKKQVKKQNTAKDTKEASELKDE
jgi:hypothetical protein